MKKRKLQATTEVLPSQTMSNIDELMSLKIPPDDDAMLRLEESIDKLSQEDKRILCHYAELRSFRKMAEVMGASANTWRREMIRIRQLITRDL